MISTRTAKIISMLPESFVNFLSRRVVDNFLNKYANVNIKGKENLKGIKTPTLFVCNHLSNSDGLVLDKALKEIDPTFVAGVKLSDNAVTSIGVNVMKTTNIKPDSTDMVGLRKTIKLIKQGESLLIFPEGTRSRVGSLIEAKKGILLIAKMTKAPIVPIGLTGTEILLPISKEGDMSSEKFNHADVVVNIGKQFNIPKQSNNQDKKEYGEFATKFVMNKIAELLPEKYKGVYK